MRRTGVALLFAMFVPLAAYAEDESTADDPTLYWPPVPDQAPEDCPYDRGVVGHRTCPDYGVWGAAREHVYAIATIGAHMRILPRIATTRTVAHAASSPTTTSEKPAGADVSYGFAEGLTFAVASPLFLGFEVEIGLSSVDTDPNSRMMRAGALALAGLHLPLGVITLDGEIAAGGRLMEAARADSLDGDPMVEARARAKLWLSPWLTLGGVIGTSLINDGEWMAGIQLNFHSWAYGGR